MGYIYKKVLAKMEWFKLRNSYRAQTVCSSFMLEMNSHEVSFWVSRVSRSAILVSRTDTFEFIMFTVFSILSMLWIFCLICSTSSRSFAAQDGVEAWRPNAFGNATGGEPCINGVCGSPCPCEYML